MKKRILAVIGVLVVFSAFVYGAEVYDVGNIAGYDFANVIINGELSLEKDQSYTRESDGAIIPSTVNWNGTTYVPLRLMSELLGADVGWDGSILIDLDSSENVSSDGDFSYKELSKKTMPYISTMSFDIKNAKTAYIERQDGTLVTDVDMTIDPLNGITINNTYVLGLKETFNLTVVQENGMVVQPFYVKDVTADSFEYMNGQWMVIFPANEEAGFYHPMTVGFYAESDNFTSDFSNLQNMLMVEGSNEGVSWTNKDSYQTMLKRVTGELSVRISERNQYVWMVSMFPRPQQDTFFYSHALDRDTLFYTQDYCDSLGRGNLYRMDEQFLAMISYTQDKLRTMGLDVEEKVGIAGFSASSDWATRLTMLYPERIKFLTANLVSTMLMTSYEGHDLPYPLGMSNIDEVIGTEFDGESYAEVPQFWFVGGSDFGDGTTYDDGWGNYGDRSNEWNQEGIDYRAIFGEDSIARRVLQMEIMDSLGFDKIEYISYPGLEHGWDDEQLDDIDDFIESLGY